MTTTHIASVVKDAAPVIVANSAAIFGVPLVTINQYIQALSGLLAIVYTLYRFRKSHRAAKVED